jgi:UDP-N-acetylglucosamine 1-carboxyvinyltransferase
MDKLVIEGGQKLRGTVAISGAKNSALPILAATLLTDEKCVLKNVPVSLRDIITMLKILRYLGVKVQVNGDSVVVEPKGCKSVLAPYKFVSTMRASVCLLGPLLAKQKSARVSFPGGCVIGPRPIDLHLKGISALGAKLKVEGGYIIADGKSLKGSHIYLGGHFGSSVLATANVMMAATLAKGRTIIENAACEPEIIDLVNFLKRMGARIKGELTHRIEIEGVKALKGAEYTLIPDRIETGTYMVAAAITGGKVTIKKANPNHAIALIDMLRQTGVSVTVSRNAISVKGARTLKPVSVTTLPYPGFPTDMQAQFMALMCIAGGISVITEKIYPERFIHISELNRMGASIILEGPSAIVAGVSRLSGAPLMASDLRASAALVLAGLAAKGTTEVHRVYHLDRGYEHIEQKLSQLGARIWREKA